MWTYDRHVWIYVCPPKTGVLVYLLIYHELVIFITANSHLYQSRLIEILQCELPMDYTLTVR